jgi:diguanylate cyclase (GGDEF)-like protein
MSVAAKLPELGQDVSSPLADFTAFVNAVVEVTRERTQDALEFALITTIHRQIRQESIDLFRLTTAETFDRFERVASIRAGERVVSTIDHTSPQRWVSDDSELAMCFSSAREQMMESGEGQLIHYLPISVGGKVRAALRIAGVAADGRELLFISGLLRVYQNFLVILEDNERDTLTGLLNRKTFDTRISTIIAGNYALHETLPPQGVYERREDADDVNYWLVVMDIDRFKRINDQFGHLYGDEVLLLMARIMRRIFRLDDLLFRFGGEEFIILLAPVTMKGALHACERFRQAVEFYSFPQVGQVTVSMGLTTLRQGDVPTSVISRADMALYYAKESGRNRICHYEKLVEEGALSGQESKGGNFELF